MNNTGQPQSNNHDSNGNRIHHGNPPNPSPQHNNNNNNNMYSPAAATNSNEAVVGAAFGSTTNNSNSNSAHFLPQQQGTDINSMDDIQFNASLDALLNGDQLSSVAGSTGHAHTNSSSSNGSHNNNGGSANGTSFTTQQQQQQQDLASAQPYLVSAGTPGTTGGYAPSQQQPPAAATAASHSGQQQQQQVPPQLAGLPLASAHQPALQLVPQGAHSAAQMSLSAAHAAITGAFHPGNPVPSASVPVAPFPWTITSSGAAPATTTIPTPTMSLNLAQQPQQQPQHQHSTESSSKGIRRGKRAHDVSAVSEDEGDRAKRRNDRNMREQQRSHRITEQIAELREVLSAANLQFKPDKYSTLTKVVEYIRQLQERSQMLDVEHKKLLDTIAATNEIVNNQYVPAYTSGSDATSLSHHHTHNNDLLVDGGVSSSSLLLEDESLVYVRGLDYKSAFQGCGIPLALSSIDGRFLDCNDTFLQLTGYSREELLPLEQQQEEDDEEESGNNKKKKNNTVSFSPNQDDSSQKNLSLFNLLSRDGMEQVFMAMSEMLKHPGSIGTPETTPTDESRRADFWSGPVKLCHQDNRPVKLNVTLVRTSRGRPKFFNCALTALSADSAYRFDDQTTLTAPSQSPSNSSSQQPPVQEQPSIQQTTSSSKNKSAETPSLNQQMALSNEPPDTAISSAGGG